MGSLGTVFARAQAFEFAKDDDLFGSRVFVHV
jgi:hypothetical protein